jgi:aryl-alcohol dehydrogenase-like predicted oxidoreductase
MRTRHFGEDSFELTELCFGTWGISGEAYGPITDQERDALLERALLLGIRAFETADSYANGAIEKRLGELLPKDARIITKIGTRRDMTPARKDFSPGYVREAVERSQERLGRECIDCVMLHNPSPKALRLGKALEVLQDLKEKGVIATYGASLGNVDGVRAALEMKVPAVSVTYNVYHRNEIETLARDLDRKIGVLVHSVLAHGLLSGTWPANKEFPPGDHRSDRWSRDALKRRLRQLVVMRPVLGDVTPTLRSVALRFALSHSLVSSVVLGARNSYQLDQLVREAGKGPTYLEPAEVEGLRERSWAAGIFT